MPGLLKRSTNTGSGEIGSLESILGLLKNLKIRAPDCRLQGGGAVYCSRRQYFLAGLISKEPARNIPHSDKHPPAFT
jgi:hypothetical protein